MKNIRCYLFGYTASLSFSHPCQRELTVTFLSDDYYVYSVINTFFGYFYVAFSTYSRNDF